MKHLVYMAIALFFMSFAKGKNVTKILSDEIKVNVFTEKGAYKKGENCNSIILISSKNNRNTMISELKIMVKNISNPQDAKFYEIPLNTIKIAPNSTKKIKINLFKKIPEHLKNDAYGIYVSYKVDEKIIAQNYQSFFRVVNPDEITVFNIETEKIGKTPIFKLDGGMSAEYIVEKSAENLTTGVSHSWKVNAPGSGPNHVLGTPDFLEKSVNETIQFYNQTLGHDTEIETVMIAPGFPSIPYISNALNAPVLPLHFLVSVNTVKEIQSILKTANDKGIASYATLSHDPSVPYAVSWIKLLGLPEIYKDFIKKHKVKNVVILGCTGVDGGETKAKQLLYDESISGDYADRSIYIMYPGTSPDDVKTLNDKISDLKDFSQQTDFIKIADWESGINEKQLLNFTSDTKKANPETKVTTVTSDDLGKLYLLGTYSTIALMNKNKGMFSGPKGVIFNPYLISHPTIELKKEYVPLLYWQLVGAKYTVQSLENNVFKAIKYFYPDTNLKELNIWLNSTRNFGGKWSADNLKNELSALGYTRFTENNYEVDEVWDLSDQVQSPGELLYKEIKEKVGFENLKKWKESLKPLDIDDIETLSEIFGGFQVKNQ